MLNRKVIATHVTNLTDARYFAARGVEYLLFDLDSIPLEKIIDIKEWVEGPDIILLFSKQTLALLDEAIIKLSPSAIAGNTEQVRSEIIHMSAHVNICDWSPTEIIMDDRQFRSVTNSQSLSNLEKENGIIVSGSLENLIGVKNFDDLDEILDSLESE